MTPFHQVCCGILGCLLGLCSSITQAEPLRNNAQFELAYADSSRFLANVEPPLAFSTELASNKLANTAPTELGGIQTMDLTRSSEDLWSRIRKGFGMTDLQGPAVDERVSHYASRPQALRTMLERGRKYLFHIVGELEKRGMPTELALLPLVESAYNPQALSSAKAAGLWQFIPSTGKDFQLTQNWWVDQRRDVVASTSAALQYLQALYEMHGDWHLALASYNWGENAVARAVNTNKAAGKPSDFNSLNMPAETRQYVPKLQALKQLIAHPEIYDITLPNIPNSPYFKAVERKGGMDVAVAAKLAEMPQSEFLALNPAFNRPVIPGHHDNKLVLPIENANKFEYNLAHYEEPLLSWKTYALPRAERVSELAKRIGVSADTLCKANDLPPRALLAKGYTLLVPAVSDTSAESAPPSQETQRRTFSRNIKISVTTKTQNREASHVKKLASPTRKTTRTPKLAHNTRGGRG